MKKLLLIILIWAAAFVSIRNISNIVKADNYYYRSQDYLNKGNIKMAKLFADRSIQLNPREPNYYRGRAKVKVVGLVYDLDADKNKIKEEAYSDILKAYNINPNNLATIRNTIPLYFFLAVNNVEDPINIENIDKNYIGKTMNYFQSMKKRFSHDAGVLTDLAEYEKRLGLVPEFLETREMVRVLRPDLVGWHESFR